MDTYVGYSSTQFTYDKNFIMKNVTLVKQDLLNNIYTRPMERVMMCSWGTRIQDIIGDPLDDVSIMIVEQDLITVFDNDPRVELLDLQTVPLYDQNILMVFARLYFKYLDFTDSLDISINFIDS